MLKPLAALNQPDERFQHLSFRDQETGQIRAMQADDLYNDMRAIDLNASVPPEIRLQFDIARNAYLYAWFVYDFVILAEQHTYIALEMALKRRAKLEGRTGPPTLNPLLRMAIGRGWLSNNDLEVSGLPDADQFSLLTKLPELRNKLLHGDMHLSPGFTLMMMQKCAVLLNKLFPS